MVDRITQSMGIISERDDIIQSFLTPDVRKKPISDNLPTEHLKLELHGTIAPNPLRRKSAISCQCSVGVYQDFRTTNHNLNLNYILKKCKCLQY